MIIILFSSLLKHHPAGKTIQLSADTDTTPSLMVASTATPHPHPEHKAGKQGGFSKPFSVSLFHRPCSRSLLGMPAIAGMHKLRRWPNNGQSQLLFKSTHVPLSNFAVGSSTQRGDREQAQPQQTPIPARPDMSCTSARDMRGQSCR